MATVNDVVKLHEELLRNYPGDLSVLEVLEIQAQTLFKEHGKGNPAVCVQISNWFPALVGAGEDKILESTFSLKDARLTVAREHGFEDWRQVKKKEMAKFDPEFENAANAVVGGEINTLKELLVSRPGLSKQTSPYGHKATLLLYVAANGVETWRQKVPSNAVEITRMLIETGADIEATASVYGGQYNTMSLLMSSAHPAKAGLTEAIAAVLREATVRNN